MPDSRENSILDSVAEDLFSTMPLIGRSIRRKLLKTALESFSDDITPPHFEIIKLLEEVGTLHIAEIGERLQIARPQMTHLIDRLVELDIVERQVGTKDRRMINVTLTEKGGTIIKEHEDQMRQATMEALSSLTTGELEDLSASLRTLRKIFSKLE
ncbi:MarR family winged helix-turn-helix transcriptional regulator [Chloroflexota bacterium]